MKRILLFAALAAGCSSPSGTDGGGPPTDSGTPAGADGGGNGDAGNTTADAGSGSDAGFDAGFDAGPPVLTVKNYLAWCNVAVNGGAFSAAGAQTMNLTGPATVALQAQATTGFAIGPGMWHHTAGDTDGGGDDGTLVDAGGVAESDAHVTVTGTANACVWVCCPFVTGGGCSGLPDQCP